MLALADVLAALKHHVLEQVSETALAGSFVARADAVRDRDRDRLRAVVRSEHETETILDRQSFDASTEALQ
jgi:hypothetical protein